MIFLIEKQLQMYVPAFQELLDEGAIRLDGQLVLPAGENHDEGENGEHPDPERPSDRSPAPSRK